MDLQTCVSPEGRFVFGIHSPRFDVINLRENTSISILGRLEDGRVVDNRDNFPLGDIAATEADPVYEIPNAFPFRGVTCISKHFADLTAAHPEHIQIPPCPAVSLTQALSRWKGGEKPGKARMGELMGILPPPLLLALAATSTDTGELALMAEYACRFIHDGESGKPTGITYTREPGGGVTPAIHHRQLYETLANNPHLPDPYKEVMVLRPGAQGNSEIVGEWTHAESGSHVFEYFRRNSYIPWGHYAANMADDAIRYRAQDLTPADMTGLRHLYYQRTYVRMAGQMGIPVGSEGKMPSAPELENLRVTLQHRIKAGAPQKNPAFNGTLWGWNYGFGFTPTGYRMNGSHQQIHQQYALVPAQFEASGNGDGAGGRLPAFAYGDRVAEFVRAYRARTGAAFFDAYIRAIRGNRRTDGRTDRESSLVVHEDENVMAFVPKAQTSQWEVQILVKSPVGNILEADSETRCSLDRALLTTVKRLSAMGAKLITGIECAKRFDDPSADPRLLYIFLPRLPHSPGAFSEAQLRWISRHYPEDFAAAFRKAG